MYKTCKTNNNTEFNTIARGIVSWKRVREGTAHSNMFKVVLVEEEGLLGDVVERLDEGCLELRERELDALREHLVHLAHRRQSALRALCAAQVDRVRERHQVAVLLQEVEQFAAVGQPVGQMRQTGRVVLHN